MASLIWTVEISLFPCIVKIGTDQLSEYCASDCLLSWLAAGLAPWSADTSRRQTLPCWCCIFHQGPSPPAPEGGEKHEHYLVLLLTPWAQLLRLFFLKYLSTKQPFYKALSVTVTSRGAVKTDASCAATLKSETLLIGLFSSPFCRSGAWFCWCGQKKWYLSLAAALHISRWIWCTVNMILTNSFL